MRVPGHATLAAYLALFLALSGGAAVALKGKNTVFSDDIKNGQVKGDDVDEASLAQVPSAANAANADNAKNAASAQNAATAHDASSLGGVPAGQYAQALFAVVDDEGELARSKNVVDVEHPSTGEYLVTFNRNVSQCAYLAARSVTGTGTILGGSTPPGSAQVSGEPNVVRVRTFELDGDLADRDFHVAVIC